MIRLSLNEKSLTPEIPMALGGDVMGSPALGFDTLTGGSIRIPSTDTRYGATWGGEITPSDLEYANRREPIGHFTTAFIAKDVFDNWFELDDPKTKDKKDPELDLKVQKLLIALKAKKVLTEALEYERTFGYSLIVGKFDDATAQGKISAQQMLTKPLTANSKLLKIVAYSKKQVTSTGKEKKINSDRFGQPVEYRLNRGPGHKRLRVHYTRVIRIETRTGGVSALDAIWNDITAFSNIRWGLAQFLWRMGSPFMELKLHGYKPQQLRELRDSNIFGDLMTRTYILTNETMDVNIVGAAGAAINPEPYTKTIMESMSAGTRIPEPSFRGAQAGALTGSEVNEREYFKLISTVQSDVEDDVRQLITWACMSSEDEELKNLKDYLITWLGGVELGDLKKAQIELIKEQANQIRLQYMKVNEVRKLNEIKEELSDEEVAQLKGQVTPQLPFGMETELPGLEGNIQVTTATGETFLVKKLKELS